MSAPTDSARLASLGPLTLLGGLKLPRRAVIVFGIMLGIALGAFEATVVGTALPTITGELHGIELYGFVITGYLVTSTVSVPAWGRLSDLYGRLPFYLIGIVLFLAGSALAGMVPLPAKDPVTGEVLGSTMPWLIGFRALQGLGAGAVMPVGFTMVADIFSVEERARVQGWLSSVWGLSSVIGPAIGGFIVKEMGWRWVFYLNIPLGVLAVLLVTIAWKEPPRKKAGHLRLLPFLLLTASLGGALLATFALGGKEKAAGWLAPAASIFAVVTGIAFVRIERKAEVPVLDLSLFSEPMFRAVGLGAIVSGVAMFAAIAFVPLFVQGALGRDQVEAGMILAFLFVPWMLGSIFSPTLALRIGLRAVSIPGALLCVVSYALLIRLSTSTSYAQVAASMVVLGAGMGLSVAPGVIAVQTSVERARRGAATSLTQFARSLGTVLGVAIVGAVLAGGLTTGVVRLAKEHGLSTERTAFLEKQVDSVVRPHGADAGTKELSAEEHAVLAEALAEALATAFPIALAASVLYAISTVFLPPLKKSSTPEKVEPVEAPL